MNLINLLILHLALSTELLRSCTTCNQFPTLPPTTFVRSVYAQILAGGHTESLITTNW